MPETEDGVNAETIVQSSNREATDLWIISPPWNIPDISTFKIVKCRIEHSLHAGVVLEYQFIYELTVPRIKSVGPTSGFDQQCTEVFVSIDYFPYPSGVVVTFGDKPVLASKVKVWPVSSKESSYISFETPCPEHPGQYSVTLPLLKKSRNRVLISQK